MPSDRPWGCLLYTSFREGHAFKLEPGAGGQTSHGLLGEVEGAHAHVLGPFVHAAFTLRDNGYESIMINCNPETVSLSLIHISWGTSTRARPA